MVLVDTTVWSLALRRRKRKATEQVLVDELTELVKELRAFMIGPIRQEVLSGIPDARQFDEVRDRLASFDDLAIERRDYEEAARLFTSCRAKGIQGSHIDFLICAAAVRHGVPVFTTDKDFLRYARHSDLRIYEPRKAVN